MQGRCALAIAIASFGFACSDDVSSGSTGTGTGATGGGGAGGVPDGGGGSGACSAGGAPAFVPAHGCDPAALTDMTGMASVTIEAGYIMSVFVYQPNCLLVSCSTTVTFHIADGTSFQIHPLQGGVSPTADPESPFGFVNDAMLMEKSFELAERGSYPYYCTAHASVGMAGAVYVE
jgi:plastocyanin